MRAITNVAKAKCDRCGYINEVEMLEGNIDTPLINVVCLDTLDYNGLLLEGLSGSNYYICNDCWNDLLDFFEGD